MVTPVSRLGVLPRCTSQGAWLRLERREVVSKRTASYDAQYCGKLRKSRRQLRGLASRLTLRTALFVTAISSFGAWLVIWEAVRSLASVLPR